MEKYETLLLAAINASIEAGKNILSVYSADHEIEIKGDNSPLTIADRLSHNTIVELLLPTGIPLLSEEGRSTPFEERRKVNRYWLVDPLDGTKEFIKRNGEFTVNIALIENKQPVLGVIYVPVSDVLYFGSNTTGSFMINDASLKSSFAGNQESAFDQLITVSSKLPVHTERKNFTVVASRSHPSPETETLIENLKQVHGELKFISKGSSIKICLVAEGKADIYPRLAPTMEWDTAAGQAIAVNAGCTVTVYPSGETVHYNKENLLNPFFIVERK